MKDDGDDDDVTVEAEIVDDGDDDAEDDAGDGGVAGGQLPDLSALLGGGGMPDLGGMMDGLAKMQEIQAEVFEGRAGGGLVRIKATGRFDIESVEIDPAALEDGDADLLADLVLAALRDLTARIATAQEAAMGPLGGLLG